MPFRNSVRMGIVAFMQARLVGVPNQVKHLRLRLARIQLRFFPEKAGVAQPRRLRKNSIFRAQPLKGQLISKDLRYR